MRSVGRVPRNTLSRARIVEAALALVDTEGLDQATMPRLAERLGVGTMSLYRHVKDKDDLLDGVVELVVSGIEVPPGADGDWEGRVVGYARRLRQQALAHPALARLLAERGLVVGPVFDQLEEVLGILRAAGFSPLGAVRSLYALVTYVVGYVVWEIPRVHRQPAEDYVAQWNKALDRLDPAAYPNLRALRGELATAASEEQFEYGLDQLVRSMRPRRGR